MKRVKLTVAYDGTNYCGWQVQPNGLAVQEVLNRCLSELLKTKIEVIGASRTDAGVHALGNVAVFDTEARMPAEKFSYALNTRLPQDIRIQNSCQVPDDFHPRFQETVKTYEYKIYNRKFPDPTKRLYTYFYYYPPEHVKEILEGKNRELAGETARPEGLTLVEIRYPEWEAKKDGHLVSVDPLPQKDDYYSD